MVSKKNDFEKLFGSDNAQIKQIRNAIYTGCLGIIFASILGWFGFHVFINEFVREMSAIKTFVMWFTLVWLISSLNKK